MGQRAHRRGAVEPLADADASEGAPRQRVARDGPGLARAVTATRAQPDVLDSPHPPEGLHRHYFLIALVGSAIVLGAVPTVAFLAHLVMSWPVLWTGIAVTAAVSIASTWLARGPLARRREGIVVLYAWAFIDLAALGAVVATSGGDRSWFWIVFLLMAVFCSVGFPMRWQLVVLAAILVTFTLACLTGTTSLNVLRLVWKLGAVVTVFVTASVPALELRRQTAEHRRARHEAGAMSAALARREAWWRSLIERTGDPILAFDAQWRITFASPAFEAVMGYSGEEILAMELGSMIHPDEVQHIRTALASLRPGAPFQGTTRLRAKTGAWHDVEVSLAQVADGTDRAAGDGAAGDRAAGEGTSGAAPEGLYVANLHDVTERVLAEAALSRQATCDALTGLANRSAFHDALRTRLAHSASDSRPVAVLFLDLENFKRVNGTIGHAAADALLVEMGRRVSRTLRDADVVARLGTDEFAAVLATDGGDPDAAVAAARRVLRALDEPVELDGRPYWVRGNIGVTCTVGDGATPEELLQHAGRAMYTAKRTGVGVAIYDERMEGGEAARFSLLGELRRAISTGELRLVYQPKVSPRGGLVGFEALVRWQHPQRGLISPGVFLPIAEESGLVRALTGWVFPTALRQLSDWAATGRELSLSVNVSAQDLADEQFPSRVGEWLREADVEPERLIVELTESSAIADYERGTGTLAKVRDLGVRLSLDDFGTGYSSLAYLAQLPLDEIKLDRGFLRFGLGTGGFLVRSVVEIGQHLGLTVVAEGVETEGVLTAVVSCGCDVVQGYVYAEPHPPGDLAPLFDRWELSEGRPPGTDPDWGCVTARRTATEVVRPMPTGAVSRLATGAGAAGR